MLMHGTTEGVYYIPIGPNYVALALPGLEWCKGSALWPVKCQYKDNQILVFDPAAIRNLFKLTPAISDGLTGGFTTTDTARELEFLDLVQSFNFWGSVYHDGARKWIKSRNASLSNFLDMAIGYLESGVPLGRTLQNYLTIPGLSVYNAAKYHLIMQSKKGGLK